jgi:DNA-binding transcriptional regulator YiaG
MIFWPARFLTRFERIEVPGSTFPFYYVRTSAGRISMLVIYAKSAKDSIPGRVLKAIKEEVLTGARWALLSARSSSGLSQADFADALGVSKRTLENWEQGRAEPPGPAKVLLNLVANTRTRSNDWRRCGPKSNLLEHRDARLRRPYDRRVGRRCAELDGAA